MGEQKMATLLVFICVGLVPTKAAFLKNEAPVLWEKVNIPVSKGILHADLEVFLVSPCLMIDNTTTHHEYVSPSQQQCNVHFSRLIETIQTGCEGMSTSTDMTDMFTGGQKSERIIPFIVVGVIAGAIVVSGFVTHNFLKSSENAQDIKLLEGQMKSLASQANANFDQIRNETNLAIENIYKELGRVLDILSSTAKHSFLVSTINFKIQTGIEASRKSFNAWKKNEMDSNFFSHFNVSLPCNDTCPLDNANIISCAYKGETESVRFRSDIPKIETDLILLKAKAFTLMHKKDNLTCTYSYVGPKYAVVSKKTHCVYPIRQLSLYKQKVLIIPGMICMESNKLIKSNANYYKETHCDIAHKNDELSFFQIEKQYNVFHVYCPGLSINYGNFSTICSYDEIHAIPADISFRVRDFVNNGSIVHIDAHERQDQYLGYKANAILKPIFKPRDVYLTKPKPITVDGFDLSNSVTFNLVIIICILAFVVAAGTILAIIRCCRKRSNNKNVLSPDCNFSYPIELSFTPPS